MADEPDILEGFPDLLDIAYRREQYLAERKGKVFNTQWADDVATLLAAVRSLIQQTRDLRADEGELSYEVVRSADPSYGTTPHVTRREFKTTQQAMAHIEMARSVDFRNAKITYEIVAVRRHVVQTVAAGG